MCDSCISPPQIHKIPTLKKEMPSPPAAASQPRTASALGSSDGEMWMDEYKEEMMTKEKIKNPSGWKCALCQERYQDREVYISHMAEQHGKVRTSTSNITPLIFYILLKFVLLLLRRP